MDFDNLFDRAMSTADDKILETMGTTVYWFSGSQKSEIRAVFDVPGDDVGMNTGSGEIRDTAPTLFTRSAFVAGIAKYDRVTVGDQTYWVVNPGWDELGTVQNGMITITLARGEPGRKTPPAPAAPSKPYGERK